MKQRTQGLEDHTLFFLYPGAYLHGTLRKKQAYTIPRPSLSSLFSCILSKPQSPLPAMQ